MMKTLQRLHFYCIKTEFALCSVIDDDERIETFFNSMIFSMHSVRDDEEHADTSFLLYYN